MVEWVGLSRYHGSAQGQLAPCEKRWYRENTLSSFWMEGFLYFLETKGVGMDEPDGRDANEVRSQGD